jgi:hypothetical protein
LLTTSHQIFLSNQFICDSQFKGHNYFISATVVTLAPVTMQWMRKHGSAPVRKRRKLSNEAPQRRSDRLSQKAVNIDAALDEALANAIELESFSLDPVANRLRTAQKSIDQTLVCSVGCSNHACRHPKKRSTSLSS